LNETYNNVTAINRNRSDKGRRQKILWGRGKLKKKDQKVAKNAEK